MSRMMGRETVSSTSSTSSTSSSSTAPPLGSSGGGGTTTRRPTDGARTRFPQLRECAHFHYEFVELGPLQLMIEEKGDENHSSSTSPHHSESWRRPHGSFTASAAGSAAGSSDVLSIASYGSAVGTTAAAARCRGDSVGSLSTGGGGGVGSAGGGGDSDSSDYQYSVRIRSRDREWIVRQTYQSFSNFDRQLHRCIYDRRYSMLPDIASLAQSVVTTIARRKLLSSYLRRFSAIACNLINCGPILTWMEMDNRGHRLVAPDDSAINVPAIAAAHVIKRYTGQAPDELTLEVGDIISLVSMPPRCETTWWQGKKSFEVGFFPCECVELIGESLPAAITTKVPQKPVLRKRGKLITFLRAFFSSRPSRSHLKQTGIVKERVFGCDLGEHLLNSGHDVPVVLTVCAQAIESAGIVDGIYRLSGVASNIQKLRNDFDSDRVPELNEDLLIQDIHSISSLLKMYFRDLPNPLFTYQLYDKFVAAMDNEELRLARIYDVVQQLPPPHYRTACYLMKHLNRVASFSSKTNMHCRNLAIVWAPNLLRSKVLEQVECSTAALSGVCVQAIITEYLIMCADVIFTDNSSAVAATTSLDGSVKRGGHPRPVSMLVTTGGGNNLDGANFPPPRLLSLEEARKRALLASPRQRFIEVGGGPTALPREYHTVVQLHGGKKSRSEGKYSLAAWKSRDGGAGDGKNSLSTWKSIFSRRRAGSCRSIDESERASYRGSTAGDEQRHRGDTSAGSTLVQRKRDTSNSSSRTRKSPTQGKSSASGKSLAPAAPVLVEAGTKEESKAAMKRRLLRTVKSVDSLQQLSDGLILSAFDGRQRLATVETNLTIVNPYADRDWQCQPHAISGASADTPRSLRSSTSVRNRNNSASSESNIPDRFLYAERSLLSEASLPRETTRPGEMRTAGVEQCRRSRVSLGDHGQITRLSSSSRRFHEDGGMFEGSRQDSLPPSGHGHHSAMEESLRGRMDVPEHFPVYIKTLTSSPQYATKRRVRSIDHDLQTTFTDIQGHRHVLPQHSLPHNASLAAAQRSNISLGRAPSYGGKENRSPVSLNRQDAVVRDGRGGELSLKRYQLTPCDVPEVPRRSTSLYIDSFDSLPLRLETSSSGGGGEISTNPGRHLPTNIDAYRIKSTSASQSLPPRTDGPYNDVHDDARSGSISYSSDLTVSRNRSEWGGGSFKGDHYPLTPISELRTSVGHTMRTAAYGRSDECLDSMRSHYVDPDERYRMMSDINSLPFVLCSYQGEATSLRYDRRHDDDRHSLDMCLDDADGNLLHEDRLNAAGSLDRCLESRSDSHLLDCFHWADEETAGSRAHRRSFDDRKVFAAAAGATGDIFHLDFNDDDRDLDRTFDSSSSFLDQSTVFVDEEEEDRGGELDTELDSDFEFCSARIGTDKRVLMDMSERRSTEGARRSMEAPGSAREGGLGRVREGWSSGLKDQNTTLQAGRNSDGDIMTKISPSSGSISGTRPESVASSSDIERRLEEMVRSDGPIKFTFNPLLSTNSSSSSSMASSRTGPCPRKSRTSTGKQTGSKVEQKAMNRISHETDFPFEVDDGNKCAFHVVGKDDISTANPVQSLYTSFEKGAAGSSAVNDDVSSAIDKIDGSIGIREASLCTAHDYLSTSDNNIHSFSTVNEQPSGNSASPRKTKDVGLLVSNISESSAPVMYSFPTRVSQTPPPCDIIYRNSDAQNLVLLDSGDEHKQKTHNLFVTIPAGKIHDVSGNQEAHSLKSPISAELSERKIDLIRSADSVSPNSEVRKNESQFCVELSESPRRIRSSLHGDSSSRLSKDADCTFTGDSSCNDIHYDSLINICRDLIVDDYNTNNSNALEIVEENLIMSSEAHEVQLSSKVHALNTVSQALSATDDVVLRPSRPSRRCDNKADTKEGNSISHSVDCDVNVRLVPQIYRVDESTGETDSAVDRDSGIYCPLTSLEPYGVNTGGSMSVSQTEYNRSSTGGRDLLRIFRSLPLSRSADIDDRAALGFAKTFCQSIEIDHFVGSPTSAMLDEMVGEGSSRDELSDESPLDSFTGLSYSPFSMIHIDKFPSTSQEEVEKEPVEEGWRKTLSRARESVMLEFESNDDEDKNRTRLPLFGDTSNISNLKSTADDGCEITQVSTECFRTCDLKSSGQDSWNRRRDSVEMESNGSWDKRSADMDSQGSCDKSDSMKMDESSEMLSESDIICGSGVSVGPDNAMDSSLESRRKTPDTNASVASVTDAVVASDLYSCSSADSSYISADHRVSDASITAAEVYNVSSGADVMASLSAAMNEGQEPACERPILEVKEEGMREDLNLRQTYCVEKGEKTRAEMQQVPLQQNLQEPEPVLAQVLQAKEPQPECQERLEPEVQQQQQQHQQQTNVEQQQHELKECQQVKIQQQQDHVDVPVKQSSATDAVSRVGTGKKGQPPPVARKPSIAGSKPVAARSEHSSLPKASNGSKSQTVHAEHVSRPLANLVTVLVDSKAEHVLQAGTGLDSKAGIGTISEIATESKLNTMPQTASELGLSTISFMLSDQTLISDSTLIPVATSSFSKKTPTISSLSPVSPSEITCNISSHDSTDTISDSCALGRLKPQTSLKPKSVKTPSTSASGGDRTDSDGLIDSASKSRSSWESPQSEESLRYSSNSCENKIGRPKVDAVAHRQNAAGRIPSVSPGRNPTYDPTQRFKPSPERDLTPAQLNLTESPPQAAEDTLSSSVGKVRGLSAMFEQQAHDLNEPLVVGGAAAGRVAPRRQESRRVVGSSQGGGGSSAAASRTMEEQTSDNVLVKEDESSSSASPFWKIPVTNV